MASSIGLLSPGQMGASVGACLTRSGLRVCWAADGRSEATAARAEAAGLEACKNLDALVAGCDAIISVCPPSVAESLARQVCERGFRGLYVDANAVAPATTRGMAALFDRAKAAVDFVDGGVVGPPAQRAGTTRLVLSGPRSGEVAGWFSGTALEARVVGPTVGAASALKMVYAGWTKGSIALLAAVYATARAEGVEGEIVREWEQSIPELPARLRGLPGVGRKAWRFAAEMREIAMTFEAAGLPGGFHEAAAELYERLADLKDQDEMPDIDALAARLIRS